MFKLSFRDRVVTKIPYIDGTAKFGWGPEDPVDEGQLELRGVVFTESPGGSLVWDRTPDNPHKCLIPIFPETSHFCPRKIFKIWAFLTEMTPNLPASRPNLTKHGSNLWLITISEFAVVDLYVFEPQTSTFRKKNSALPTDLVHTST